MQEKIPTDAPTHPTERERVNYRRPLLDEAREVEDRHKENSSRHSLQKNVIVKELGRVGGSLQGRASPRGQASSSS